MHGEETEGKGTRRLLVKGEREGWRWMENPMSKKDEKIRNRGIEKEMRTKYRREEMKKYGG